MLSDSPQGDERERTPKSEQSSDQETENTKSSTPSESEAPKRQARETDPSQNEGLERTEQQTNYVSRSQRIAGSEGSNNVVKEQSQVSVLPSSQPSSNSDVEIKTSIDDLWENINGNFKNIQGNRKLKKSGFPWGEKFKEILREERGGTKKWEATDNKWKDCKFKNNKKEIEEGCYGAVAFSNGRGKYKMRVTYTPKNDENKNIWKVWLVKNTGDETQCYNSTLGGWSQNDPKLKEFFSKTMIGNETIWEAEGCVSIQEDMEW